MLPRLKFLFAFLLFATAIAAQDTKPTREPIDLKEKMVYGGNLGLQIGSQTLIDVSPLVGYKVTDRFVPGVGLTYRYISWRYQGYPPVRSSFYGGSIWARYYVIPEIFLHGEYESLNGEWEPYLRPGKRYFLNTPFLGGGYSQNFGGMSSYIMLLYIVNYSNESPYANPLVLRVGFTLGI